MFRVLLLFLFTRVASGASPNAQCGDSITVESPNYLTSPGYPTTYPPSQNCEWILKTVNKRIIVEFNAYFMLMDTNCTHDYVEVYDGGEETSPKLGRFCGTVAPQQLVSTRNVVLIKFVTDNENEGAGFSLQYERSEEFAVCGDNIVIETEGSITHPAPPFVSLPNQRCAWVLTTPETHQKIVVGIEQLYKIFQTTCEEEYFEIYDGGSEQAPLLAKFCEREPQPVISSGNKVLIKFVNDLVSARFKIQYRIQEKVECGGNIAIEPLGHLTTEGYPMTYRPNQHCVWVLTAPEPEYKIAIKFIGKFYLEGTDCKHDYMEIFDGGNETSHLFGRFCRSDNPPMFVSRGGKVLIKFVTDNETAGVGFSLQYDILKKSINCGGKIDLDSQNYLTSPGYPMTMPPSQHCVWEISAPSPRQKVILDFNENFHVGGTDCMYDYVEVFDGNSEIFPSLGRFCGTVAPPQLISTSSILLIKFVTDSETEGMGFSLRSSGKIFCGRNMTINSPSYLSSLGFPSNYEPSMECVWVLTAPESDQKIVVNFNAYFEIADTDCRQDYLEVYDGGSEQSPVLGRFCGTVAPPQIISTGNSVLIKFITDKNKEGAGFSVTYKIEEKVGDCSRNFTAPTGNITIPDVPKYHSTPRHCTFMILATNGSDIIVDVGKDWKFHTFCHYDFVEIWDGFPSVGTQIGEYCVNNMPSEVHKTPRRVVATSGILSMTVTPNRVLTKDSFSANYTIVRKSPSIHED
ncbi:tolloid-like protein 1 isoform X2 [Antennarius striatus]|uniref:tolloid-like protein 1 isoform X2 n=1 Tax=Antennarius striatus TaxID=241820 RepID=UPI0035AF5891